MTRKMLLYAIVLIGCVGCRSMTPRVRVETEHYDSSGDGKIDCWNVQVFLDGNRIRRVHERDVDGDGSVDAEVVRCYVDGEGLFIGVKNDRGGWAAKSYRSGSDVLVHECDRDGDGHYEELSYMSTNILPFAIFERLPDGSIIPASEEMIARVLEDYDEDTLERVETFRRANAVLEQAIRNIKASSNKALKATDESAP